MRQKTFWLVYSILLGMVLIRIIPILNPEARAWGFNHLIFLPVGYTITFFLLSALALILPFFEISKRYGQILVTLFSTYFFEHHYKYLFRLIFIAFMAGLFTIFATPTHFLGDGYMLLGNVASSKVTTLKWTEKGVTLIQLGIQYILGPANEATALKAFRIVSIVAGVITCCFYFLISEMITNDRIKRVLVFMICFFSGSLLLYFGYVENYPLLWVGLTGFIYFGLRYHKIGKGLIWSFLFLAFGIFVHLQMAVLIPAFIYLLFSRGIGFSLYTRYGKLLWSLLALVVCGGIILFINLFKTNLYFEHMFLPIFTGKPIYPKYSILSLPHLLDIVNELFLISPLLLIFFALSFGRLREIFKNNSLIFLALTALGSLFFLLIIDPKLSMPRDWDLFSISVFGLMLILVILQPDEKIDLLKRLVLPVTAFLMLFNYPFLLTNLNKQASVNYFKYIINLDPKISISSIMVLKGYFESKGNFKAVDSMRTTFSERFPNKTNIDRAIAALTKGDYELANQIGNNIKPNKFLAYYHHYMALKAIHIGGDYNKALKELDDAVQLGMYNAQIFTNRAQVLVYFSRFDEAIDDLNWSFELDRANIQTIEGLTLVYSYLNKPDSSIYFAQELLTIDSLNPTAFFYLTESYYQKGEFDKALSNANLYQQFGERDLLYASRMQKLSQFFSQDTLP